MSTREHLHSVADTLQPVVKGVSADEMAAPTPCTDFDDAAVGRALEIMEQIGEMGRSQGAEVPMPDDAAPFDKVLAQAGREPEWSAT